MEELLRSCCICPRKCNVNRLEGKMGFCGADREVVVAKAFAHPWEEPCISGVKGSGTVFFSGCNLKCVFCQNYEISQRIYGKAVSIEKLADIFLSLCSKGVHNINLVSPTIYTFQIIEALKIAKKQGLKIPIIWNSNAYETAETLKELNGIVDVYLPDLKYNDESLAARYSKAHGYFEIATKAILEMFSQVGEPKFDNNGMITKGLMIRHLILPGHVEDSKKVLDWISKNLPKGVYLSLMSQYMPYYKAKDMPEINRKLSDSEYDEVIDYFFKLGLENGFAQEEGASSEEYVPDFDLEGLDD